jgi:hypothetical protein
MISPHRHEQQQQQQQQQRHFLLKEPVQLAIIQFMNTFTATHYVRNLESTCIKRPIELACDASLWLKRQLFKLVLILCYR